MNFKHTALAAVAALGIFGAGQASATITTATFSTNFDAISTFDGVAFGSPTAVDVTVQFDQATPIAILDSGVGFFLASASFNIAGKGTFSASAPLTFMFSDVNFVPLYNGYLAGFTDMSSGSSFGAGYSSQSPSVDLLAYQYLGIPLPDTIAFSGHLTDTANGSMTIQFTSGDTLVIDPVAAPAAVPEPATLALLGIAGLGFLRRRKAA